MKEKWTNDLQKKMNGFEVPTIPEGLWENIDSALDSKTPEAVPTAKKASLFPHWRKACAAILLLLAIPMTLYLLQEKTK